jgi:mannose-6-phosphate isomerase
MIVKIANHPRDYAWGSKTLMADYFGWRETGAPMAEVWFGTHPGSPATLADNPHVTLREHIGQDLPFLLKLLAADRPLSIQAHPNLEQARAGFERENAAGLPLSAAMRNYRDANHKPEAIVALTNFEALCGFRSLPQIKNLLLDMVEAPDASETFVAIAKQWLDAFIADGLAALVAAILRPQLGGEPIVLDGFNAELARMADFSARFELASRLNELHPGDPGVVLALLLNHVYLEPGEALYLPAGNVHAYLGGLGVEVMASSDNVLRGGLTSKHIDVPELLSVLDFESAAVPRIQPRELAHGLVEFPVAAADFKLYRASVSAGNLLAEIALPAAAIALCVGGDVELTDSRGSAVNLRRGEAAYLSPEARHFTLAGNGDCFIALG